MNYDGIKNDKGKPKKPSRLSTSSNVSIGGKKFNSQNVSANPSVSMNRSASGINTAPKKTFIEEYESVDSENRKASDYREVRTQVGESILSHGATAYSTYSAMETPKMVSDNVRTQGEIASAAQNRVLEQTAQHHSDNAVVGGKTEIHSEIGKAPEAVSGGGFVRTESVREPQSVGYQPNVQPVSAPNVHTEQSIHTQSVPSQTAPTQNFTQTQAPVMGGTQMNSPVQQGSPVQSVPSMVSDNVRTGGEISRAAESRVLEQTAQHHTDNAKVGGATEIHSSIDGAPRTVEAVRTAAQPTEQSVGVKPTAQPVQNQTVYNPAQQGSVVTEVKTAPVQGTPVMGASPVQNSSPVMENTVRPTQATPTVETPKMVSDNVRTQGEIASAAQNRVLEQTAQHHSDNAVVGGKTEIHSQIGKNPETVGEQPIKTGITVDAGKREAYVNAVGEAKPISSFAENKGASVVPTVVGGEVGYQANILNSPALIKELETSGIIRADATGSYQIVDTVQYQAKVEAFIERNGVVQVETMSHGATVVQPEPIITPIGRDGSSIKTADVIQAEAQKRVLEQTEQFHESSAIVGGKTEIHSSIDGAPRTVEAVRTAAQPTEQSVGAVQRGGSQQQNNIGDGKTPVTAQGTPVSGVSHVPQGNIPNTENGVVRPVQTSPAVETPRMVSDNVRTQGEIASAAQNRVLEQTAQHHSDNAVVGGKTEIHSQIGKNPETVGEQPIKTGITVDAGKRETIIVGADNHMKANVELSDRQINGAIPVAVGIKGVSEYQANILQSDSFVRELEANGIIRLNGNGTYQVLDTVQYQAKVEAFIERNGVVQVETMSHGATVVQPEPIITPIGRDGSNIKTADVIQAETQKRVLEQTAQFHESSATVGGKTEIHSGIDGSPRTVDLIKTGATDKAVNGEVGVPLARHGVDAKQIGNAHFPVNVETDANGVPIVTVGKGNIKTANDIASAAQERAMGNVKDLVSGKNIGIEGIQTGGVVVAKGGTLNTALSIQSETGERHGLIPVVGVGKTGKLELSQDAIAEIKMNLARNKGIDGIAVDELHGGRVATGDTKVVRLYLNGKQFEAARAGKEMAERFRTGTETTREFVRGLGVVASYGFKTEAVRALEKWKNAPKKNDLITGGKMLLGKAEATLMSHDDLGTQGAGGVVAAGLLGATAFKGAQTATVMGVNGIKTVGNGIYEVSTTTGKTIITVGKSAKTIIQNQVAPISRQAVGILKANAINSGLDKTAIAKSIIQKVDKVKATYKNAVVTVKKVKGNIVVVARGMTRTAEKAIRVVHGVATGRMTVKAAYTSFNAFKNRAFHGLKTGVVGGIKTAAGYTARGVGKATGMAVFRGTPTAFKLGRNGALTAAGMMAHADDYAVQGVGYAVQLSDVGIKTAVAGAKATGYTVKTAVDGGKKVYAGAKFIKNKGLRAAWDTGRQKAKEAVIAAGKSIVSAMIEGAKALGMKVIIPLLLIVCVGVAMMGGMNAPVMAVGAIFSGTFSAEDTQMEHDIRDYLLDPTNGIPALSAAYRQDLADEMSDAWRNYHIVRFYSNTGGDDVIDPTFSGITSVFPTDEELANMLQPIFNAIIVMEFELEPTEAEAQALLAELFNKLFRVTTATSVEQCGQALIDGEGTVTTHACGSVHALADCPNTNTGTHSSYTCSTCCYYYWTCDGHRTKSCGKSSHSHSSGCYSTDPTTGRRTKICGESAHTHRESCYSYPKCNTGRMTTACSNSTKHHDCSGYTYCGSHNVISYTLTLDGAYALEAEYFTDPINRLSSINPRTPEQESQLQNLKDYYEIYQEIMSQVGQQYGGGLTMADLSGVHFVNGSRTSCQAVIDLALSQVGQQGGQPYWSYYGFGSRVEWCACFVHWCMRHTPSATNSYPTTANNAYCQTIANNFMSMGQWGDRNYTNLVAGDTIFFDWQGDGHTDHIGLVIGRDDTYVYTVEGNSGDAVKCKSYLIGSSVIYGYGLMNY